MSTVDEIKKAAGALSVNEREELLSWLLDVDDEWDRQMGKDAAAGKLDFLIEEARTAVREEIFGPVVTITPFDNEEEVIGYANDTEYGLASSVWTQNLNRAHRVAEQIHTGTVWVNCWLVRDLRVPFGGMKQSGVGREGGEEALRFFTEPKNICIAK